MDPDDRLLKHGSEEIQEAIDHPQRFLDFHIEFHNATKLKGTSRRDYLHEILSNINNINDTIIKNELIKDLSERFIIKEREKASFESFVDIEKRVGLKEPIKHMSQRIVEEISGETRMNLFVKR